MRKLEQKFMTINSVKIAYTETGTGTPVVFIHGFGLYSITWQQVRHALPRGYRLLCLDLKGFGFSDKPDDDAYSAYDQVAIVRGFLEALELESFFLVGHSFGGLIALMTALDAPGLTIKGVAVISSVGYYSKVPEFIVSLKIPILNRLALEKLDLGMLAKLIFTRAFFHDNKARPEHIRAYARVLKDADAKNSFIRSAEQFTAKDVVKAHAKFKALKLPVLVIWGVDDRFIPVQDSYLFRRDIPGAALVVIPECGHLPQEECPSETAAHLAEFFEAAK